MAQSFHPLGERVIVRCRDAGVHFGTLTAVNGDQVKLTDARRLWYWRACEGQFLNGVASSGLHSTSKVSRVQPTQILRDWCEILPTSDEASTIIDRLRAFADGPNQ